MLPGFLVSLLLLHGLAASPAAARQAKPAPAPAAPLPAATAPAAHPVLTMRVALVPEDSRPVCFQDVRILGLVSDIDVVGPPPSRLGRADQEGDADGIVEWLDGLDVATLDAVIVSTDMLVYGGLAGSQKAGVAQDRALARLAALGRLKARRHDLQIYAFSTLLRLKPPEEGHKGQWKDSLEQWAVLGGGTAVDSQAATEARVLEGTIPPTMIDAYRAFRARNLAVTLASADAVTRGDLDALVVGTQDATVQGLAAAERDAILAKVAGPSSSRVAFAPGTDGIAALLLARAAVARLSAVPAIAVERTPATSAPDYGPTLDAYRAIIGGRVTAPAGSRSLTVLVFSGRDNAPAAASAAERAATLTAAGATVSIGDVSPEGVPGASQPLAEDLRNRHLFLKLAGYAAGGEPSTTLAAALAQGVLRIVGLESVARRSPAAATRLTSAHAYAQLRRLTVDFVYQTIVRPQAVEEYLTPHKMDPGHLNPDEIVRVRDYLKGEVQPLAENLVGEFGDRPRTPRPHTLTLTDLEDFSLSLPWGRLDEVEIAFRITSTTQ